MSIRHVGAAAARVSESPLHPMPRRTSSQTSGLLLRAALQEGVGAAVVLDPELRVVDRTPRAELLIGAELLVGEPIARVLCGNSEQRPVAEALAAGRPVSAQVARPAPAHSVAGGPGVAGSVVGAATQQGVEARGDRIISVRAVPLVVEGERVGWLMLLDEIAESDVDTVDYHGLLTRDPAMKRLLRDVEKVARSTSSVLVRGETGSGKELVARAIHLASRRSSGPFRALNCAALPAPLLESELFGHVRGAFTGAVRDAPGHLRLADGGTLFLDEVAELPLELQAKVLRVLQDRTVLPVGGREAIPVDVRFVAATHRSLRAEVEAGRFRADLMYRLRVVPLFLPPLRERPTDVELLARHFVARYNDAEGAERSVRSIADGACRALRAHPWPGNVRELQNAVEYAFVMGEGPVLTEAELPPEVRGERPGAAINATNAPVAEAREELPEEAQRILHALERAAGSRERAAKSLGMSRATLWRKMRSFGLSG